ncbi:DNA polymerase III subunit beta [Labilibaculum filiforme]|uniref:DNA polymerase III subunit beta n=2 Tax=Labilibaculum filiforme TaxID=1940526 RepID=A0A2N3I275_9BACT|nr:DNA polymerase III subunit beta [Labilibaculum filiforme]
MYGLTQQDMIWIKEAIKKLPEIQEAILFGSRAMGNYKIASDVDLCIKGSKINSQIVLSLRELLEEEYSLPYFFDVVHYEQITNEELRRHIDEKGKRL